MKKFIILSLVMIALVISLPSTLLAYQNATEQRLTSSLYMAPDTILTGSQYDFMYPNYKISLYPNSFYNFSRCRLLIDLYKKDFIGKTLLSSGIETMEYLNTTYTYYRGSHGACKGFYYFETRDGGIQANPVYLYSYQ